jgi:hypothetical protein
VALSHRRERVEKSLTVMPIRELAGGLLSLSLYLLAGSRMDL